MPSSPTPSVKDSNALKDTEKAEITSPDYQPPSNPYVNRLDSQVDLGVDDAYKVAGEVAIHFSLDEFNRVKRKIDWRVPGLCSAVYFLQFLDKTALNYASVTGFPIKGQQYNLLSMAFYIGFIAFVFPTQWLAQRFDAAKYLGINVIFWAIALALHAVSGSFASLFTLRLLTGAAESCVAPILISIIVAHYPKNEQGLRISCFYVMNGLTEVFGGLLAYGITFYDGSFAHWKIIYILLGCLSFAFGLIVIHALPASPMKAKFLNSDEKRIALERVRGNSSGTSQHKFKKAQALESLKDLKFWLVLLVMVTSAVPNGGLSNFSSKLIKGFGYDSRQSLILGVPKGAIASLTTLFVGWISDRRGERMLPILIALLPTVLGAALLVGFSSNADSNKGVLLFGIYLTATFGSALSIVYSWNATNIAGSSKKTFANASTMFTFALGNIMGTEIFQEEDSPNYIPGKVAVLILLSIGSVACIGLRFVVVKASKKKEMELQELKRQNGWDDQDVQRERDAAAFKDLTDGENPFL